MTMSVSYFSEYFSDGFKEKTYLGNEPNQGQNDAWDNVKQPKRYSVRVGTSIRACCTANDVDDESTTLR